MCSIFTCCLAAPARPNSPLEDEKLIAKDKYVLPQPMQYDSATHRRPRVDLIHDLVVEMQTTSVPQAALASNLGNAVEAAGWWEEAIAQGVLAALKILIRDGYVLGTTMQEAFDWAYSEASQMEEIAEEFAAEHPLLVGVVCAVVALGVLYLLWPTLLTALGFGELGPVEGSFAAGWQALYGGRVPYGSLFSYLQKLGMLVN